ncbi:MAG: hypothetical protein LBR14_00590 [Clostridiales Family XIII bacterium]|jgi:hypothetical protein|nr:hypothetical protein [Clostridiales Family XIII bacterium]
MTALLKELFEKFPVSLFGWIALAAIAVYLYVKIRKENAEMKVEKPHYDYEGELQHQHDRIMQDLEEISANGKDFPLEEGVESKEWRGLMETLVKYFREDAGVIEHYDEDAIPEEFRENHKKYCEGLAVAEEGIKEFVAAMNNKKIDLEEEIDPLFDRLEEGSDMIDAAFSEFLKIKDA